MDIYDLKSETRNTGIFCLEKNCYVNLQYIVYIGKVKQPEEIQFLSVLRDDLDVFTLHSNSGEKYYTDFSVYLDEIENTSQAEIFSVLIDCWNFNIRRTKYNYGS